MKNTTEEKIKKIFEVYSFTNQKREIEFFDKKTKLTLKIFDPEISYAPINKFQFFVSGETGIGFNLMERNNIASLLDEFRYFIDKKHEDLKRQLRGISDSM